MKSRALVFIFIFGVGAVAVGWIYESQFRPKVETAELMIPNNIDYFLTNINYRVMSPDGSIDYEFKSRRLEHYPRTDISQIESPSLQIYRAADHWQVDALQGEFEHNDNLLRLSHQVVIQKAGADPIEMRTESIRFEPDKDLVSSEASVVMHTMQARIEAEQAIFDLAGKVYWLTKTRAVYN